MLKSIQQFFLGLLRASAKEIKELTYFALSVALRVPSMFFVFYFVFVYGMEDRVYKFGAQTFTFGDVHVAILIGVGLFFWFYISKLLKTKKQPKKYGFSQIVVRFLLPTRYILVLMGIANILMIKFTLTKINTYFLIVIGCFLLSYWFEAKYYESANLEWSD